MREIDAIKQRHSVRRYKNLPIKQETIYKLQEKIDEINQESGLHIQLVINEEKAFESKLVHYGMFNGVKNYLVLVGKNSSDLEEKCGYYGEKLVLYAQDLGLNTCWVALTYSKSKAKYEIKEDEKLVIVITIGYGETQGKAHKSKSYEQVTKVKDAPNWYKEGIEAALLAPTAVNQQNFIFDLKDNNVELKAGFGFSSKIDLGIVKYHFEVGAGKENFNWNK